jgi:hypothetical protein
MAVLVGRQLPENLVKKIKTESRTSKSNEVVLLCTIDDEEFPNISLLSYLDLVVVSPRKILVAIGEASSSKRNLLTRGKGTIVFWAGRKFGMYYVRGRFSLLKNRMESIVEGFACSALACAVQRVNQDYTKVAEIESTLTYDASDTNESHFELQRELRGLCRSL